MLWERPSDTLWPPKSHQMFECYSVSPVLGNVMIIKDGKTKKKGRE